MALPFQYTYSRNATIAKIKAKKLSNIRVTGLKGNMNVDQPWIGAEAAVGGTTNETMPGFGEIPLDHFSSTCLYFGEGLADATNVAPMH